MSRLTSSVATQVATTAPSVGHRTDVELFKWL